MIQIQCDNFEIAEEYQALRSSAPNAGAIVFFVGLVSELYDNQSSREKVEFIELSHYAGMTESRCWQILDEVKHRFEIDRVRLVHRVGRLQAGEQIVFVGVASRHRHHAFKAAQFIMDYLKTEATIWKKEVGSRGEHWLGTRQRDRSAAGSWQPKQSDATEVNNG